MLNSGKLSPMKAINQAKQSIDLDALKGNIPNFDEKNIQEMMSGASTAMDQVGKLPFDKLGDFPIGELTKDIQSIQGGFNIEPRVREKNVEIEKLTTSRKPKTTMIIKTNTKTSSSGSTAVQIPKSVKTVGGSSVNSSSIIKTLQELESAFT